MPDIDDIGGSPSGRAEVIEKWLARTGMPWHGAYRVVPAALAACQAIEDRIEAECRASYGEMWQLMFVLRMHATGCREQTPSVIALETEPIAKDIAWRE